MATEAWERRRRAVAGRIEETAMELFAAHGVDRVSVQLIAETAGISERTFYRYFPFKEDVLRARPQRMIGELPAALLRRPPDEGLMEAFCNAARATMERLRDEQEAWDRWARVVLDAPRTVQRVLAATDNPLLPGLERAIALRLGDVPGESVRSGVLAHALVAALEYVFERWLSSGGAREFSAWFEEAMESFAALQLTPVAEAI